MIRKLTIIMLAAFLAFTPALVPSNAYATDGIASVGPLKFNKRLLAVGAGAIVGIVVFNMLTYPMGSVPFVSGPLAATPVNIALGSRFLATMVGGGSALAAHYLYKISTE